MQISLGRAVALVVLFVLAWMPSEIHAASPLNKREPAVMRDLPDPGAVMGERRRSLDLYLPADNGRKPPLLIFVHGGFWLSPDDDFRIGPAIAQALVPE